MKSVKLKYITVSLLSFARALFRPLALAACLLFLAGPGCRSSPEEEVGDVEAPAGAPGEKAGPGEVQQDRGLPGPPGTARSLTATDPAEKEIEERLFKTDGGRIVLKGIHAHGGWLQWLRVKKIDSVFREVGPGVEDPNSPPPDPKLLDASMQDKIIRGPFYLASPSLRLEYLGVELDSGTGKTYDKVQIFQESPNAEWLLAYFDRHTGILERILFPRIPPGSVQRGFTRIDLQEHREVEGLWLPTRWVTFFLPDRYSRADLSQPERVEKLEVTVDLKDQEAP